MAVHLLLGALLAAASGGDPVIYARAMDRAAKTLGINFIGGYSALVHKGFSAGDRELIASIPEALSTTDFVCSSVNVGSTKAGINMDAVALMGGVVVKTAQLTADRNSIGAAKLVGRVSRTGRAGSRYQRRRFRSGRRQSGGCKMPRRKSLDDRGRNKKDRVQDYADGSARRRRRV